MDGEALVDEEGVEVDGEGAIVAEGEVDEEVRSNFPCLIILCL